MSELSPDLSDPSSLGPAIFTLQHWFEEAFEHQADVSPDSLVQLIKQTGLVIGKDIFLIDSADSISPTQLRIFHQQLGPHVLRCLELARKRLEVRSASDNMWVDVMSASLAFTNANLKICLKLSSERQAGLGELFALYPHIIAVGKVASSSNKATLENLDQALVKTIKVNEKLCTDILAQLLSGLSSNMPALQALGVSSLSEDLFSLCRVAQDNTNLVLMNLAWKYMAELPPALGELAQRILDYLLQQVRNSLEEGRLAVRDMQAPGAPSPSPQVCVVWLFSHSCS